MHLEAFFSFETYAFKLFLKKKKKERKKEKESSQPARADSSAACRTLMSFK